MCSIPIPKTFTDLSQLTKDILNSSPGQYQARQLDLFTESKPLESSKLYEAIDALNARYGKGTLVSATQGLKTTAPAWKMKRDHLSRRASTNWLELMTVS